MNQTKQEAAEAYSKSLEIDRVRFSSGEIEAMREEAKKDFIAGAEWAQLKWISVTERLPENQQPVLFAVNSKSDTHGRILGGKYTGHDFSTPGMGYEASHWCAIPDSLLNFKP